MIKLSYRKCKCMEKLNNIIKNNIMKIFIIFLFIQPILDVITSVALYRFNISLTLSSIVRIIFLMFTIYYLLYIDKNKFTNNIISIILVYSMLFLFGNIIYKQDFNIVLELKNLFNNIYFPVLLVFLFQILKNNRFNELNIYYILCIYLLLVFVPNILNIGFDSYAYSKEGSTGLFYSANAVGCIISIISPILIAYLIQNKKKILLTIFFVIYLYVLVTMGTKAPLLCTFIIIIYYLVRVFVKLIREKKYKNLITLTIIILLFFALGLYFIRFTPFYDNLLIHLKFLNITKFSDMLTFRNIDHFIFSSRLSFFKDSLELYLNQSIYQKLFGIGYVFNGKLLKLAEMDYLDILIHQGLIGFISLYFIYFKIIIDIFKTYFSKFKSNFLNIRKSSIMLSIIISILYSFLVGHVLATPAVSIFVALLLVIYYNEIYDIGDKNEKI